MLVPIKRRVPHWKVMNSDISSLFNWQSLLEPLVQDNSTKTNYVVMILNHCFDNFLGKEKNLFESNKFKLFSRLWNNAAIRYAVDGGSNYLYELQKWANGLANPHLISGDFDSISASVKEHYQSVGGVRLEETPDQNYTDFRKALQVLSRENVTGQGIDTVYVMYTSSDRIDQYLSILSTVHSEEINGDKQLRVVLVDLTSSISFVLAKGKHVIPTFKQAKWCSLVPLTGPVTLTTTGFRWNLSSGTLRFGEFISSSNEFDPSFDHLTVQIMDRPILFSTDFK